MEETKIKEMVGRGAIFYVSHSGGKDSQAMMAVITKLVPEDQIVVVHAHLPGVVWRGTRHHARVTTAGYDFIEVTNTNKDFLGMVEKRGMWPSPQYRQCTSDLKRDPINKAIRADLKAKGKTLAVNCIGIRGEESSSRSKAKTWTLNKRMSKAGREVYDCLPIHDMLIDEVFQTIKDAGQEPHWVYSAGMSRLSCCICIMSSNKDLKVAKRLAPEVWNKYVALEKEIGHTMRNGETLEEAVS